MPDATYPPVWELKRKFSFGWHSFNVHGAADAVGIDDLANELAQRQLKREQFDALRANLHAECQQFVSDYVLALRREVAAFCDQVIESGGQVHGRTLQAIRRRIDRFHAMNIFDDADTAAQLAKLKAQLAGVTGEDLAQQPALSESLHRACELLRKEVRDEAAVSALSGRLTRRVVLE